MSRNSSSPQKLWLILLLPFAFLSFKAAMLFMPGLDSVQAIDPFINGNLPVKAPQTELNWVPVHTAMSMESPQLLIPFPGTNLLLYVEMDGRFFTIPDNDNATDANRNLVMDIQDRCWYYGWANAVNNKHGGFQNAVFHPQFAKGTGKDYIYVYYTYHPDPTADTTVTGNGAKYYDRLSRFTWTGTNFDPDSELIMIQQYDEAVGHDGGGLLFGNDGFLYVSVGDEGHGNMVPNSQRINDRFRGGIWRIDVDMQGGSISHPIERQLNNSNVPNGAEPSFTQGYYIPNDNPWVTGNGENLEEFYATGLRQPFRMSYDADTELIWIGDVGSNQFEEVNILDKPGLNFQWAFGEGFGAGAETRAAYGQNFEFLGEEREPVYAYPEAIGSAVIGGYIYKGTKIPSLTGKYIFGDNVKGTLFALDHAGGNSHNGVEVIGNAGGSVFNGISSFGFGHDNELMALKLSNGGTNLNSPAGIFKLVEVESSTEEEVLPQLLSETGIFSDLQNLTVASGIIPYETVNPLWSSGTDKLRWVALPQDGTINSNAERIGYSENEAWTFPVGTTFIKQFNNPNGTKLETRLWIHGEDGEWYGSTYKWRSNGLEADLLLEGAFENITIDGENFSYEYPAANQCAQCHNPSAGYVLGFSTRQLNKDIQYPSTGRTANQLETLAALGFIPEVDTENVATLVPIEDNSVAVVTRVRSYFDSNCAYCHLPGNTRANFDLRFSTPLASQNLINGTIVENFLGQGASTIKPGDISNSMLYHRVNSVDPSLMMPPSAKGRVDTEAVQLLEAWISSLNGTCDEDTATVMGNTNLTDNPSTYFIDGHSPHININKTDAYTNNTGETVSVCLEDFNFYARRLGNPITPFVSKVNAENDFTVVAIGETRLSTAYSVGVNTFNFSDHTNDAVVLQPGESIVPGFMDAYPDGSESVPGGSLIPANTAGNADVVWQSYQANANSYPHLVMGITPQGNSIVANLGRSYQFNIGINISSISHQTESNGAENIAYQKPTTQSSTEFNGAASRAVDGNTSGVYTNSSITHTEFSENPWLRVDLGAEYDISQINIFNRTDLYCENSISCPDRLAGAMLYVGSEDSDDPADYTEVENLTSEIQQNFEDLALRGRYIFVYLPGSNKALSLAEVQVYGKEFIEEQENIAYQKPAIQSSTEFNGAASRAVDGNTSGVYTNSSITHTEFSENPWWRVDLGAEYDISQINIFNRTDLYCENSISCLDRVAGAMLYVGSQDSDDPSDFVSVGTLSANAEQNLEVQDIFGRYVMVYLPGNNKVLSLAEVQVYGNLLETDIVSPLIALKGDNPLSLIVGDDYEEFGASAMDNLDGDISETIQIDNSAVNTSIAGTYQVIYKVTDASQNSADQVIRLVVVKEQTSVGNDTCQCASGETSLLINGSFEDTSNPNYDSAFDLIDDLGKFRAQDNASFDDKLPDTDFPGWFTTGGIFNPNNGVTSVGGILELGQSGFLGAVAADGTVFAELNGNHHNQLVTVTPGQVLDWELSHRGRNGIDTIDISAGPIDNQTVIATVSSPAGEWTRHTGQYQVPIGVTEIQFTITPVVASDNDLKSSNLLDLVKLCPSNGIMNTRSFANNMVTEITLYPNPVNDVFNLKFENSISQTFIVEVYSILGARQQVNQITLNNQDEAMVFVGNLTSGTYSVVITDEMGLRTAMNIIKN